MENRYISPNARVSALSSTYQGPYSRNSVLTNISNTFQRSQISTSRSKNHESRNKSKIKVLPNYKPQSLSGAMPFVTVFQTIEIQRLSEQIQVQRARLHQAEKQAFNAINYEVQIQELTQKCTTYQSEIKQYQEELSKMNKICESLYYQNQNFKGGDKDGLDSSSTPTQSIHTIDSKRQILEMRREIQKKDEEKKQLQKQVQKWSRKYQQSQNNKQKELQKIKQIMQVQRRSMLERQIKELEGKHQTECANLNMEIKRISDQLEIRDSEIYDLKTKAKNADDYIKQLQEYGKKLSEYENKISLLNNEHMRLSQIVDTSSLQLNNARKKQFELTKQIQTDKEIILDNNYLKQILETKQKELENWKTNIITLEEEISKGRELYLINQELQAKIGFLKEESVRANSLLRERLSQIEKWKKMALELEDQVYKLKENEYNAVDIEGRQKILRVENERISNLLKVRTDQLQEIKEKWRNTQNSMNSLTRIQRELKTSQQKYRTQVERNKNLQIYIEQLENSRNFSATCELKSQQLQQKLQYSQKQSQNLKNTIALLQSQLTNCKQISSRMTNQQLQLKKQSQSNQQHEQKIALLSQQIERLNELLKDKNIEITKLEEEQISKFNITNEYKRLQGELLQKEADIQSLKQQLDRAYEKNASYESEMLEIQHRSSSKMAQLNNRQKSLTQKLNKKSQQYQNLHQQYSKLQKELSQNTNTQKLCQKQQNRITVYLRDIDNLKNEKNQMEQIINQERNEIRELREQISSLEHKLRMDGLSTSHNRDSEGSSLGFNSKYSKRSKTSSQGNADLMEKVNVLQNTIHELRQKYQILLSCVQESSKQRSQRSERSQNNISISRVSSFANR